MLRQLTQFGRLLLAGLIATGILVSSAQPQSSTTTSQAASSAPATANSASSSARMPSSAPKPTASSTPYRNQPDRIANRAAAYYEAVWGIEAPNVKAVESGVILRFSYRVLDPGKAKLLSDKKFDPVLVSPAKGVKLVVPTMEKVGQLRQAPHELEAGKSYWMAFSNSGRLLRPGDRVDIVIGNFHAQGLLIE
jgi:hypothetical protein